MEALLQVKPPRTKHEPQGQLLGYSVAESFFGSLKKERIKKHIYKTRALATEDLSDYIEAFYNRIRRHTHLGGISPEEFEATFAGRRKGVH